MDGLEISWAETRRTRLRAWWREWLRRIGQWDALQRVSAWPSVARIEAGFREIVTMPNLLDEDPLQEISLYLSRKGEISVHHPRAQTQEQMILVANILLKASQVVAAQAGAQVVSQPQAKKE